MDVRRMSERLWTAYQRRLGVSVAGVVDPATELELDALLRAEGGDPSPGKPEGDRESVPVDARTMTPEQWTAWKRERHLG